MAYPLSNWRNDFLILPLTVKLLIVKTNIVVLKLKTNNNNKTSHFQSISPVEIHTLRMTHCRNEKLYHSILPPFSGDLLFTLKHFEDTQSMWLIRNWILSKT